MPGDSLRDYDTPEDVIELEVDKSELTETRGLEMAGLGFSSRCLYPKNLMSSRLKEQRFDIGWYY